MPQIINLFRLGIYRAIVPGAVFFQFRIRITIGIGVYQITLNTEGNSKTHHVLSIVLVQWGSRHIVGQITQIFGIKVMRHIG